MCNINLPIVPINYIDMAMKELNEREFPFEVLSNNFDLEAAVAQTADTGYFFARDAVTTEACEAMSLEAEGLNMRPSEENLINAGTSREVTQSHERSYMPISTDYVPVATFVTDALMQRVQRCTHSTQNCHRGGLAKPDISVIEPEKGIYLLIEIGLATSSLLLLSLSRVPHR